MSGEKSKSSKGGSVPFFKIERLAKPKGYGLHQFSAYLGTDKEKWELLENSMQGLEQIFGRRAAKAMAKRVYNL